MKKRSILFLSCIGVCLAGCSSNSNSQAELIQKVDALQQNIRELQEQIESLQEQDTYLQTQLDKLPDIAVTTLPITTAPVVTTKKPQATTKRTTKATTKPSITESTETSPEVLFVFDQRAFDVRLEQYRVAISTLSQDIAVSSPSTDERVKQAQLEMFQGEILRIQDDILHYGEQISGAFLDESIDEAIFDACSISLQKMENPLIKLKQQLNTKFSKS